VRKPFGSLYLPKLFLFVVPIQLAPVIIMSPREVTWIQQSACSLTSMRWLQGAEERWREFTLIVEIYDAAEVTNHAAY
jgi:hypothetical protein